MSVSTLEPYVDLEQLASHFGMSERWLERRVREKMPCKYFGRSRRFQISRCEDWLVKEGHVKEG